MIRRKRLVSDGDYKPPSAIDRSVVPETRKESGNGRKAKRSLPDWKEKRQQQDKRKLVLVEELLHESSKAAVSEEDSRRASRDADEQESDALATLRNEIKAMRKDVVQNVRSVKEAVQELTQLILSRQRPIL